MRAALQNSSLRTLFKRENKNFEVRTFMNAENKVVGGIELTVELPNGESYHCKGIITEDCVMSGSEHQLYPGVSSIIFPNNFVGFRDNEDVNYTKDDISEMICFAINDGGADSSLWEDLDLWFEITSNYTRAYPFNPQD